MKKEIITKRLIITNKRALNFFSYKSKPFIRIDEYFIEASPQLVSFYTIYDDIPPGADPEIKNIFRTAPNCINESVVSKIESTLENFSGIGYRIEKIKEYGFVVTEKIPQIHVEVIFKQQSYSPQLINTDKAYTMELLRRIQPHYAILNL